MRRLASWIVAVSLFTVCAQWTQTVASSSGIAGFSGNPATGGLTCNECHQGGTAPTVVLDGPTSVAPGTTHTYTLMLSGGQQRAGGLDVSTTAGFFSVVDPGTRLENKEILHSDPRPVNPGTFDAIWSFNWTAPAEPGVATFYGVGNSVNLQAGTNGDRATAVTLVVSVGQASTPGEASGPALQPLLVAAHDIGTGDLSLTYDPSCATTDHNLYFGALGQVAAHAWTGSVCDIGSSGSYVGFNPGPGSYFFVVVGNQDGLEGSYGTVLQTDGSQVERPPLMINPCGESQDLSSSCD